VTTDEKLAAMATAEQAVLKAIDLLDSTWGEFAERAKTPRSFLSLNDARNLLERAGAKIGVAKRSQVAHQLCEIELQGHAEFAAKWLAWCATAARTIELCRELVAAAEKI
jgi:hypothetical protein